MNKRLVGILLFFLACWVTIAAPKDKKTKGKQAK